MSERSRLSILIVDDTPANLAVLCEILTESGFELRVAEDGASALDQMDHACPDLILLDVLMPGIDGFETCRRLKARPDTRDIPVIFMTALTDTVDKIKGFEFGAVDYITKPFHPKEVLARVSTHLALHQLKQRLQENEERLSSIFESTMDAILTLDPQGCITLFNHAAERIFRCPARDAIGRPCARFLSEGLRHMLAEYMGAAQPGCPSRTPIWVPEGHSAVRADGEVFPIEASLARAEASGEAIYTLILHDIEERKKAEAECQQLRGLNRYLEQELQAVKAEEELVGASGSLREVMSQVQQVAGTDATVLISGETGTGKEIIAQAIHRLSLRKERPFIKLNCATLPASLIESELFGHEKGAFTGARVSKPGRFELADGGTLFLDEIGELALELQAKLLRVLQEGEFERLGATRTSKVNVRIIAATNRNLKQCVQNGQFRADLFYRLNVFPIAMPPLRERQGDIMPLVEYFVRRYSAKYSKKIETVPEAMIMKLKVYPWPGNVRELQHVIERAVILTQGTRLALGDWFQEVCTSPEVPTLEEIERAHILKICEATGWRVSGKGGAAELLGLKPTTLEWRMKKLSITRRS
jgi:PAS domain S-box